MLKDFGLLLNMLQNICCSLWMIVDINFNRFFFGFTNRFSCQTAHNSLVRMSVWITIRAWVLIKSTAQMVPFFLIRVGVILEKFVGQWWGFVIIIIFWSFVFHLVLVKIHITFFFVVANFIWGWWFLCNFICITWCLNVSFFKLNPSRAQAFFRQGSRPSAWEN